MALKLKFAHAQSFPFDLLFITIYYAFFFQQVVASEPVNFAQKMMVWIEKKWNPCDLAVIIFFLVGMILRLNPATRDYGRVIYCLDIMYWYIRSLDFLSVNKYLGPYVTMIGKMVSLHFF